MVAIVRDFHEATIKVFDSGADSSYVDLPLVMRRRRANAGRWTAESFPR
ncbi:MAG TPA: hypothetical protein VKG05_00425 [Steroidobacteraceae bacterium]|nr:hypothetical protein [Steroidobacteraceae bacterium]